MIKGNPDYEKKEVYYIASNMANWFGFLVQQESKVFQTPSEEYSFHFSRRYREEQDHAIARVLTICLNGANCLDRSYQGYEEVMPYLSYRSQIIDDVADTVEDLKLGRPSYTVGALRSNPDELAVMRAIADSSDKISKINPQTFREVAPRSYGLVKETYNNYGSELAKKYGTCGEVLDVAGKIAYHAFPIMRNVLHRVNDRYANF